MRMRAGVSFAAVHARALPAAWPWYAARLRLLPVDIWQFVRRATFARRLMEQTAHMGETETQSQAQSVAEMVAAQDGGASGGDEEKRPRALRVLLVRHGQTTYNVEGRLPGQLPGVPLTDEGRLQAHRVAVALSGLRLDIVVSSPLERAMETARIIARGWALDVREDARLMDTDVGGWAGRKIGEIAKDDPTWGAFLKKPTEPPPDVESLDAVQARAVAAIEALRGDATVGENVVVVAHADVIKLIVARYTGITIEGALALHIANASITALAFAGEHPPALLATNWTAAPGWLVTPAPKPKEQPKEAPTLEEQPATDDPVMP
jgi:broad specificity phosphatase PhoE